MTKVLNNKKEQTGKLRKNSNSTNLMKIQMNNGIKSNFMM
jgi:hypothetical protein